MTQTLSGKKIFVTGADGFIGSHLIEHLVRSGADVRALTYYNSWNQLGWLSDIDPHILANIEIFPGDVRDTERMREGVRGCDYVLHLASLIAIPYSYVAPGSYVETNVLGAMNILNACRASDRLERLVHISTSEVYGSAQQVPIPETHPLVGQSPYSASKIGADKMAESYYLSFGLPVVTARPFNTFGPRQTARAVIPTIASQLAAKVPQIKLGSMTPTRDFNFARDTARGIAALALCEAAEGEVVNIGTGEEYSIDTVLTMLQEISGHRPELLLDESRVRPEKSEVNRLCADTSRIRSLTDWAPQTDLQQGLEETYVWVEKNIHHFSTSHYAI